jgi:uncharacterized membrane protein HdeD (DUF308 family)
VSDWRGAGPGTTAAAPATPGAVAGLRRLYLVRFGFALLWAVALFVTASELTAVSVALLVLYPLFDVAAAVVDGRSSGWTALQYANIGISALAAVGLAVAAGSGSAPVVRVWGAWAIAAGLVQFVVGLRRRRLGGQWAMIVSGTLSVLAGVYFVLGAGGDVTLRNLANYAVLGGIFFLVAALRLGGRGRGR